MSKWKWIIIFTVISTLLSIPSFYMIGDYFKGATFESGNEAGSADCDTSLWKHVYSPERLQVIDECMEVTGTVEEVSNESDGDFHIGLKLDEPYSDLINRENVDNQNGDLVVEAVCAVKAAQPFAMRACQGFSSSITVPPVGAHVKVTGSYVLDTNHGWMEIHPVSRIEVAG